VALVQLANAGVRFLRLSLRREDGNRMKSGTMGGWHGHRYHRRGEGVARGRACQMDS